MKREGKVTDKTILVVLAILIVVTVVIIVVVNSGKKSDENKGNSNGNDSSANSTETDYNGPKIDGSDNVKETGDVRVNISEKLKQDKTYDIYSISNIYLESVSGNTTLTATISADVSEKVSGKPIKIEFYDKDGNVVETMSAYMPQVKPGETSVLTAQSTTDLTNAYDFKIVDAQ